MQHTKSIGILVALVVSIAGIASASFTPSAWQYMRTISSVQGEFVKVILPNDISWTDNTFADIRIIGQDQREVPYLLTKNIASRSQGIPLSILNKTTRSDGYTQALIDMGNSKQVHTDLSLVTSGANFRRQVSIYSSDALMTMDDPHWNLVTDKGYIFRFTDQYTGFTSGNRAISFPASTARYFKVVISAGPEGPVEVSSAEYGATVSADVPSYTNILPVSVFNNSSRKTTEVTVDLGKEGVLSNGITITPLDHNYSRRVIIQAANDKADASSWRNVGESSISGITTSLFTGSYNRISYPETHSRYIRLSIVNDDNPPLTLDSRATIESTAVSVVFEGGQGIRYTLYYGNPRASIPQYDISQISSYIEANKLPVATLADAIQNPEYVAPQPPVVPFTESNKTMLNILLVIVVLGIGAAIFFYLRSYIKKGRASAENSFEK